MPGKVRVKIIAGRNLPVMDRSNDSADAYVEIKLANVTYKTDVYRKSLNPQWNTDFYRFELDDAELQDEPLQIRLMDHDTYTANDAIGKVSISLNPLLLPSSSLIGGGCGVGAQTTIVSEKGAVMAGWIPVFDTMHGIRGEVNVVVKVDLFSDVNKFRQSSCGVQFFHSPNIPHGYHAQIIHGFVEELVVNDDPEYQWIDKIRTPRASNDARQLVFLRLSGQVQRKIGLKAIDLGANAVIGYTQCFDLEGDVGVVARGIGTAVTLEKMPSLVGAGGGYSDEQLRNLKFFQHFDRHDQSDQSLPNCTATSVSSTCISVEPATPLESPDAAVVASFAPMFSSSRSGSTRTLFADLAKKCAAPDGSPATVSVAPAEANAPLAAAASAEDDGSAEDLSNLRQLLDQEDQRGKSAHSVLRRRIQHIGRASRNALAKTRLLRRKSREDLEIARSLSESLSELSLYAASSASQLPSSLADLKVATHLGKRSGRRGSRRRSSTSSGEGMAALLVSSLMAAPSLNCIKETEVTTSGSAPTAAEEQELMVASTEPAEVVANHLDVELAAFKAAPSTLMATKLTAASSTGSVSQNSTSNLSVMSSVTSLMSSMSSISENCDDADNECGEESDVDAITRMRLHQAGLAGANGNSSAAPETVSMVVKSVLALEEHSRQHQPTAVNIGSVSRQTSSTQLQLLQLCQHHQRHHHPLDSNLLPAYLHPAADNDSDIWIKPGSTVDEPEINDSERESMFHDLKENIVETMHTLQDHMMTSSSFTSSGGAATAADEHLFHMAVAQMLRDQVALMGAPDGCVRDPSEESEEHPAKPSKPDVIIETTDDDRPLESALPPPQTPRRSPSFRLKSLRQRLASFCTRATSPALMAASLRTMLPRRLRTRSESAKYSQEHQASATAPAPAKAMSLSPRARSPIEMSEMTGMADAAALATAGESYGSTIDLTGTKMTRIKPFISLSDLTRRTTLLKPIETGCDQVDVLSPSPTTSASIDRTNHAVLLAPSPSSAPSPSISTASLLRSSSPLPMHTTTPSTPPSPPPPNDERRTVVATAAAAAAGSTVGKHSTATAAKDIGHVRAESSAAATAYAQSPKSATAAAANNGSGATALASASPKTATDGKEAAMCRRSSDSDLALTPKANHEHSQHIQQQHQHHLHQQRHLPPPIYNARVSTTKLKLRQLQPDSLDMLEYPFLTLSKYPTGFILHIGATVCARSVKLLERVPNPDEPETRDSWWKELRMEIRSHARTLGCNVILGYTETTSISDEVCVLSATGTAAIINVSPSASGEFGLLNATVNPTAKKNHQHQPPNNPNNNDDVADKETPVIAKNTPPSKATDGTNGASVGGATSGGMPGAGANNAEQAAASGGAGNECANCSLCHIPYSRASVPFNAHMKKCLLCKNAIVPDVLLATIELPDALPLTGRGCFLQAQVCRTKKDLKSESNAKEISDCLPFLEYDLHRLLINKLKMKGMNAVFGLKSTVTIGEKVIALIATGTAVFVPALPPPTLPKIVAGNSWTNTEKLQDVQRALQETVDRNREVYQLKSLSELEALDSGADDSGDEGGPGGADGKSPELGGAGGGGGGPGGVLGGGGGGANNKGTFVLEVDDIEDLEIIALLMEPCPPDGFHVVNTQTVPGGAQPGGAHAHLVRNLQMFTQIWRAKLGAGAGPAQQYHHHHHHQGGGHGHHGGTGANSSGSNFARHFQRLLQTIFFKLRTMLPCAICDLRFSLALPDTDEIQLLVTGMAIGLCDTAKMKLQKFAVRDKEDELIFNLEEEHQQQQHQLVEQEQQHRSVKSPGHHLVQTGSLKVNPSAHTEQHRRFATASRVSRERYGVELTPLSYVPGGHIQKYHGNVNFFFIRESTSIRESGGVSGFVHSFITEMLAVVRAHVTALGGNALVSFYMTELELVDNPHKNQGQCLISVGGDVVFVSYYVGE